jgi:ABC-type antimicrobial peptide transport system permease subunit
LSRLTAAGLLLRSRKRSISMSADSAQAYAMALGATSFRVTWLVFRDAGWMIATGAVVGMVLAALSGRVVATFLLGVDPLDPLTFVSVPVVILLTAIIAAAAPASRASRINPVEAFRYEG